MQCDAQNADCYIIMTALAQPLFKFRSAADHTGHFILAPKGLSWIYEACSKVSNVIFFSVETDEAREVCCGREVEGTFMCIYGFFSASR